MPDEETTFGAFVESVKAAASAAEAAGRKQEMENLLPGLASLRGAQTGGATSIHPAQSKFRLYDLTGTALVAALGEFIEFDYSPTEFSDSKQTSWKEDLTNVCIGQPQFETSKGRRIAMTVFLNDWGEDPTHYGTPTAQDVGTAIPMRRATVEEKIAWLQRRLCPMAGSIAGGNSPRVLALAWREIFKCVLTKVDVTRLKLHPRSMDAIRANVDIELLEWAPMSR